MIFCHCDRVMHRIHQKKRRHRTNKYLCTYVLSKHSVHCMFWLKCIKNHYFLYPCTNENENKSTKKINPWSPMNFGWCFLCKRFFWQKIFEQKNIDLQVVSHGKKFNYYFWSGFHRVNLYHSLDTSQTGKFTFSHSLERPRYTEFGPGLYLVRDSQTSAYTTPGFAATWICICLRIICIHI